MIFGITVGIYFGLKFLQWFFSLDGTDMSGLDPAMATAVVAYFAHLLWGGYQRFIVLWQLGFFGWDAEVEDIPDDPTRKPFIVFVLFTFAGFLFAPYMYIYGFEWQGIVLYGATFLVSALFIMLTTHLNIISGEEVNWNEVPSIILHAT